MNAEGSSGGEVAKRQISLQWSRVRMNAEGGVDEQVAIAIDDASMEPRSDERGRPLGVSDGRDCLARFNGAAFG